MISPANGGKLRRARPRSKASGFSRIHLTSNMGTRRRTHEQSLNRVIGTGADSVKLAHGRYPPDTGSAPSDFTVRMAKLLRMSRTMGIASKVRDRNAS